MVAVEAIVLAVLLRRHTWFDRFDASGSTRGAMEKANAVGARRTNRRAKRLGRRRRGDTVDAVDFIGCGVVFTLACRLGSTMLN